MEEKVEVRGHFNARLRVPIAVESDIRPEDFESLLLQDEGSRVMIRPAETEPTEYDPEEGVPPDLAHLTIWITRYAQLHLDASGNLRLTREERRGFEDSLVATVGGLMQVIRRRTTQWHLDARFPISYYDYSFFYQDIELESGRKSPAYILEGISFRDLIEPMTPEEWNHLADVLANPVPSLRHRDMLCDARVRRSQLRHNDAALYAAIAGELLLEELHRIAPTKVGWLCVKEPREQKPRDGLGWLIDEMERVAPCIGLDWGALKRLNKYRRAVAHGDPIALSRKEATDAINIADDIARIVEAFAAC